MADENQITSVTGLCPACGHENQRDWVLCDGCGARLPWAPPLAQRKKIADLSTEELKVLFAPPREKPLWQDKRVVWAILIFLSIVLPLIPLLWRR